MIGTDALSPCKAHALTTVLLLAAIGCGDEGVTHVAGPFAIDAGNDIDIDAGEDPDGEVLPPCPTGYACTNLAAALSAQGLMGTVTDPEGNPLKYGCAAKGQETCNPADPVASCPNLPQPICAHVKLGGGLTLELDQCAQRCSP
jgi:hypothetical protein